MGKGDTRSRAASIEVGLAILYGIPAFSVVNISAGLIRRSLWHDPFAVYPGELGGF